jgi:hypothetical protein
VYGTVRDLASTRTVHRLVSSLLAVRESNRKSVSAIVISIYCRLNISLHIGLASVSW